MATELCALPPAIIGVHARVAFGRSPRGPDGMLGNSILERHIDPAEGELLLVLLACLLECIVCKSTIVAMVVFDGYAVLGGQLLECFLCFYCFI
jgi:hypothetical protein